MEYHLFEFNHRKYIYLPKYKQSFQLDLADYDILHSGNSHSDYAPYIKQIEEMILDTEFVSSDDIQDKTISLFLNVANSCNCACIYCFANKGDYGKSKGIMGIDVALKGVDLFLKNIPTDYRAQIIFFGGEPLIAFDVIRQTCQYVSSLGLKNLPSYHLVTNATLLTRDMVDFFAEQRFSIGLSIDGGEKIHNENRPLRNGDNSFKCATRNIPYLRDRISRSHIRGTYYNFSRSLVEIYKELLVLGIGEIHVPPDLLTQRTIEEMQLLCQQVDELGVYAVEYYKKNKRFPFGLFVNKMRELFVPIPKEKITCGKGKFITCIDINGDAYPCHRFSSNPDRRIGNIYQLNSLFDDREETEQESCTTDKCSYCWNRNTCSHGCSYNDTVLNLKNESNWCIYSKRMTEVTIAMLSELSEDDILLIAGNVLK